MSAFYPGQPIKKVRGKTQIGLVAIVEGFVENPDDPAYTLIVRPESSYVTLAGLMRAAGDPVATIPDHWEPIVPPGLEPIEEINALYEPQGVTA